MPKWEIRIERLTEQSHLGKARTVGTYQVYHDGQKATGTVRVENVDVPLSGTTAESRGPSQNDLRADEGGDDHHEDQRRQNLSDADLGRPHLCHRGLSAG